MAYENKKPGAAVPLRLLLQTVNFPLALIHKEKPRTKAGLIFTLLVTQSRRVGLKFEVISPATSRQTVLAVFPHT
ncbi:MULTISPECIES: hypothetical protein, partial [unclassified Caballeronia]|uniref:hypothetical protein n=1 Tax=unclassified Caballeronia TaxID=2646786 RepID=UPI0020294856